MSADMHGNWEPYVGRTHFFVSSKARVPLPTGFDEGFIHGDFKVRCLRYNSKDQQSTARILTVAPARVSTIEYQLFDIQTAYDQHMGFPWSVHMGVF